MARITLSLLMILFISCGQAKARKDAQPIVKDSIPGWKTHKGSNYSIQYPPDWDLTIAGEMNTSFIILAPLDSDKDEFKENANLLIQDLSGRNMDLGDYAELSEKQIKTMSKNGAILESKRIKNGSAEYHKILFTGDQGKYHLHFEQYYWVIKGKAYVLTFTAEQNKFNEYKERGEKLLNSFSITK